MSFFGDNVHEIFGFINLGENQCALIPTNSGSNTCIYCLPDQMKREGSMNEGFGCPINTEENRINFIGNLEERQIKAYEECGLIKQCPPGITYIETFVDRAGIKQTPTPPLRTHRNFSIKK